MLKRIQEEQLKLYLPEKWLVKMAIGNVYLQEGNTFAKSIWLHLVEKVATYMAPIIELLDHQGGLEHACLKNGSWKYSIYVHYAQSKEIQSLQQVPAGSGSMISSFPFSWVLINLMDRLRQVNVQTNLLEAASQNSFVQAIHEITEDNGKALSAFTKDLLVVKIPRITDGILQMMVKEILVDARKISLQRINNEEVNQYKFVTIVDLYEAVTQLEKRIKILVEIIEITPNALSGLKQQDNDFDLDVQAMILVLDKRKPDEYLNFKDWKEGNKKIGALVSRMSANDIVQDKLLRLNIVQEFLDHVWNQKSNEDSIKMAVFDKVSILWTLKNIDFVNSCKSFDNILKVIKKTSGVAAEKLLKLKNADACVVCKGEFQHPIAFPCGHVACSQCFDDIFEENDDKKCPVNSKCDPIPRGFKFKTTRECTRALAQHGLFRKGLNLFFLNLLSKYVFKNAHQLPHPDTINMLLEFVVHKEMKTKKMSPFEADDIDPEPVIRSFILQLLLKADFQEAQVHIETFFNRSFKVVKMEVDLCLMIIYALEDQLFIDHGYPLEKGTAVKFVTDFIRNPGLNHVNIKGLIDLAKLRLALYSIGIEIGDILKGNSTLENSWLKPVQELLGNDKSESLKKYLVRVVKTEFRLEIVQTWKKHIRLQELLPNDIKNSGPDNVQDYFLLLDTTGYKEIRDGLRQVCTQLISLFGFGISYL